MSTKLSIKRIAATDQLHYLHAFRIDYLDKAQQMRTWEFVSRGDLARLQAEIYQQANFTDGATIFACDEARRHVVLIKEFRVAQGRYLYALPAGLADLGESPEQTAIREFKEETGLDFTALHCAPARYTSVGLSNEKVNIVFGYYSGSISAHFQADNEDIEVVIVDKQRAKQILSNREVPIRTALLLEHFFGLNPFFR